MRLSRYFLPVLKETPAEAQIVSHLSCDRATPLESCHHTRSTPKQLHRAAHVTINRIDSRLQFRNQFLVQVELYAARPH